MIVTYTESSVDNGSTSGTDSAEVGRLEGDEAGRLETVGLGMLAARPLTISGGSTTLHTSLIRPEKDLVAGRLGEASGST